MERHLDIWLQSCLLDRRSWLFWNLHLWAICQERGVTKQFPDSWKVVLFNVVFHLGRVWPLVDVLYFNLADLEHLVITRLYKLCAMGVVLAVKVCLAVLVFLELCKLAQTCQDDVDELHIERWGQEKIQGSHLVFFCIFWAFVAYSSSGPFRLSFFLLLSCILLVFFIQVKWVIKALRLDLTCVSRS